MSTPRHTAGKKNWGAYNPQRLHAAIAARCPQFKGRQQQDAQELLTGLLDVLADPGSDVRTIMLIIIHYTHLSQQSTAPLFTGQLCSTVVCNACGRRSCTDEPFTSLSLAVPRANGEDHAPAPMASKPPKPPKPPAAHHPRTDKQASKAQVCELSLKHDAVHALPQSKSKAIKQARRAKQRGLAGEDDERLLGGGEAESDCTARLHG